MDFDLDSDQQALVSGLQGLLRPWAEPPAAERLKFAMHPPELQQALREAGFLDVVGQGLSTLDAALVVLECAKLPVVVETAASALVWPHVIGAAGEGPVALLGRDVTKAARFLPIARHALVDVGDDLIRIDLQEGDVEPIETVLAYPYGRLVDPAIVGRGERLGAEARAKALQWWRTGIALEYAGAAASAVAFTVDYVKQRFVFGRPIGSFQAVQHRLAQCFQLSEGITLSALHAAWGSDPLAADIAATSAQRTARKLTFDLHQFNGGMGVTNEHLLHFWTHRMRALQGEAGGTDSAALAISDRLWPRAA